MADTCGRAGVVDLGVGDGPTSIEPVRRAGRSTDGMDILGFACRRTFTFAVHLVHGTGAFLRASAVCDMPGLFLWLNLGPGRRARA